MKTILFIIFLIYYIRFIKCKLDNPNQPNGTFYYKHYVDSLINKYEK